MLPDLGAIPWDTLTHAYGPATGVPALLRALSSPDKDERAAAFDALYGNIWHQGTVYEATAYAVPYLIALAAQPDFPAVAEVLGLLEAIAHGTSFNAVHESSRIFADQRETAAWQIEKEQQLGEVARAHHAVGAGIPLYLTLTHSPDVEIQATALMLLGAFPEHYAAIAPTLRAFLVAPAPDASPAIPTALLSLGRLSHGQATDSSVIAPYLDAVHVPPIRLAAAQALVTASPLSIPAAAVTILGDALRHPDDYQRDDEMDFSDEQSIDALGALLRLPADEAFSILLNALPELDASMETNDCLAIVMACLSIAWFGDGRLDYGTAWQRDKAGQTHINIWHANRVVAKKRRLMAADSQNLTPQQREALVALLACPQFWEIQTNALEIFGLPVRREAIAALITDQIP